MKNRLTIRIIKQTPLEIKLFILPILITSCIRMENSVRPAPINELAGYFFTARDGSKIYIREA